MRIGFIRKSLHALLRLYGPPYSSSISRDEDRGKFTQNLNKFRSTAQPVCWYFDRPKEFIQSECSSPRWRHGNTALSLVTSVVLIHQSTAASRDSSSCRAHFARLFTHGGMTHLPKAPAASFQIKCSCKCVIGAPVSQLSAVTGPLGWFAKQSSIFTLFFFFSFAERHNLLLGMKKYMHKICIVMITQDYR